MTAGVLSLSFPQTRVPKFEKYFSGLHPKNNTRNPWFREFWQKVSSQKKSFRSTRNRNYSRPICVFQTFECQGTSCDEESFHLRNYPGRASAGNVPLVIKAVFQVAQAIENVRQNMCPGEMLIHNYLLKLAHFKEVSRGEKTSNFSKSSLQN